MRHRTNPRASRDQAKQAFKRWLSMATRKESPIVQHFHRYRFDDYDPYGSVIGEFFDVAELMNAEDISIPSAWGYSPGASGGRSAEEMDEEGSELAMEYLGGHWTKKDIRDLGDFLNRADEYVRRLNLNY